MLYRSGWALPSPVGRIAPGADFGIYRVTEIARALLDRADHRNHIGALETQSLGLAIKGVADVEERRRDAGPSRRHGDQPAVLQDARDRGLHCQIPRNKLRRLDPRHVARHRPSVENSDELGKVQSVAFG